MDTAKLVVLKDQIENLDVFHHNKILKILVKNDIKYSENRNGVFVNMNSFNDETIKQIENTLLYVENQEKNLQDIENIKEEINKDYFENDNKEKNTVILSHGTA